jgi:hypothetical protein
LLAGFILSLGGGGDGGFGLSGECNRAQAEAYATKSVDGLSLGGDGRVDSVWVALQKADSSLRSE